MSNSPRVAIAANRNIGVQSLHLLLEHGITPVALLVPKGRNNVAAARELARILPHAPILHGKEFREPGGVARLRKLQVDYLISIHWPYLIPKSVLDVPRFGTLNLHPGYLPYNRGWHTPSWAILEQTPYGATLHWVDEGLDTGDIALQCRVRVRDDDTADTLYARVLMAELEILRDAIPLLKANRLPRIPQVGQGSEHQKSDLNRIRQLHLEERLPVGEVLKRIRALTTSRDEEAAWFQLGNERYLVQVSICRDHSYERPDLKVFRAA